MNKKLTPKHLEAWRLLITANAKLVEQIDKDLKKANQIPLNWYDVLLELYEAPNQRLRMSELADRVLLTRSGLTRLVDRLEKQMYIQREIDPEDRRGFYAIITEAGIEAMRQAWPVYEAGIHDYFGQYLSDEEAESFVILFAKILDALKLS